MSKCRIVSIVLYLPSRLRGLAGCFYKLQFAMETLSETCAFLWFLGRSIYWSNLLKWTICYRPVCGDDLMDVCGRPFYFVVLLLTLHVETAKDGGDVAIQEASRTKTLSLISSTCIALLLDVYFGMMHNLLPTSLSHFTTTITARISYAIVHNWNKFIFA